MTKQAQCAPMPKFLGVFSKRGLVVFLEEVFLPRGALATFLPVGFLAAAAGA